MKHLLLLFLTLTITGGAWAAEIAVTMDDPNLEALDNLTASEKNQKILDALSKHHAQAILFVCGKRIDSPEGISLLKAWAQEGHWLGNHTYSHKSYHSQEQTFALFTSDIIHNELLIEGLPEFHKIFRYPFLKEGNTLEKRDRLRIFLRKRGYSQGYVTIDASDWYINDRLVQRLKENPRADLTPYRNFYLKHIWDRAQFYNNLSKGVLGREVRHTLLIHHNFLNAFFLDDVLSMFESRGWKIVAASSAIRDPVFKARAKIVPAGESVLWALAKEMGKFESILRYPGEDSDYEKGEMDRLGL